MATLSGSINHFHRRSIRLKEYDYTHPGAYFVTVVTQGYKCRFGRISDHNIELSRLGILVHDCWMALPNHFAQIDVEPFIVMPNHFHGIITIYETNRRGTIHRAPTPSERFGKPVIGSIPTIVRTFKASVSRKAKSELSMETIWQRNFYEHIVRTQTELEKITLYILANPSHWAEDPEYIP